MNEAKMPEKQMVLTLTIYTVAIIAMYCSGFNVPLSVYVMTPTIVTLIG